MTRDTRERLEMTLPPLRLPKAGEPRSRFERRLDARLASLARLADLAPSECVGLALWLGKADGSRKPWRAFAVDLSDCEENPTRAEWMRNAMIAATEHDGEGKELPAQRAATAAGKLMRSKVMREMKYPAPADSSLDTYVRQRRAERGQLSEEERGVRNPELLALYMHDESKASADQVRDWRRDDLRRELRWSGDRLWKRELERQGLHLQPIESPPSIRADSHASKSDSR